MIRGKSKQEKMRINQVVTRYFGSHVIQTKIIYALYKESTYFQRLIKNYKHMYTYYWWIRSV